MTPWLRNITGALAGRLPTILTLGLLVGIGVWGANNDWKISDAAKSGPKTGEEKKPPASPVKRVEFPSADAVRMAGIKVARVKLQPMARYVTANGMLDYEHSAYAQLATRAAGSVWSVEKEINSHVKEGDVLALIDAAEVGKVKADLVQSLAMVDFRTLDLKGLKSVSRAIPPGTMRKAQADLRAARIRLFNDHQRLLNLGLRVRLDELAKLSDQERVRHLRLLGLPPEFRRRIKDPETFTANLLPVVAPFDGQVVELRIAPGEVVDTRRTLFAVGDVRRMHIELEVHIEDAALLRVGQKVTFAPENKGGLKAVGKLVHFSPEVGEKTRNVRAHAETPNPHGRLKPHTYGTGSILVARKPRAVVVPQSALQSMNEGDRASEVVFVRVSPTAFETRPVRLGLRQKEFVEVLSGVRPGEKVVTTGSHALKSELLKDLIGGEE